MDADDRYVPQPLAGWFKIAAIASVVWFMLGCANYLYEVMLDPATLPLDQRAMMEAAPTWMYAAFAVAVWVGLIGAVLLLLRKKLSVPLLGISLIAVLVQFSAYFLDPQLREVVGSDMLLIPIIIVAVTWTVFWFAWHSRNRGWLS
jgi:hypothetical protein